MYSSSPTQAFFNWLNRPRKQAHITMLPPDGWTLPFTDPWGPFIANGYKTPEGNSDLLDTTQESITNPEILVCDMETPPATVSEKRPRSSECVCMGKFISYVRLTSRSVLIPNSLAIHCTIALSSLTFGNINDTI